MLAAPIVNPIVLWSTSVAYRGREPVLPMVLGRAGLALAVAIIVGLAVGHRAKDGLLEVGAPEPSGCPHCGASEHAHRHGSRASGFVEQASRDFLLLSKYLIIGASVAGALQTFVPQGALGSVAGIPVLDVAAMMGLAALLSLCSESDAFVAASFVQFGYAPQLGFLVFGPMVDAKLGFLYAGTFGAVTTKRIVAVAAVSTLVGTLILDWLVL